MKSSIRALVEYIDDIIVLRNPYVDYRGGVDLFLLSVRSGKIYNLHCTSDKKGMDYAGRKEALREEGFVGDLWINYNTSINTEYSERIAGFSFIKPDFIINEFKKWEADDEIGVRFKESKLQDFMYRHNDGKCWELYEAVRVNIDIEDKYVRTIHFLTKVMVDRIKRDMPKFTTKHAA